MEFQAKTIGNATLIVNKVDSTILVTDPWFDEHSCYFGSWRLTHEVPKYIKEQALKAKYILNIKELFLKEQEKVLLTYLKNLLTVIFYISLNP